MFSSRTKKNRIRVCSPCTCKSAQYRSTDLFFGDNQIIIMPFPVSFRIPKNSIGIWGYFRLKSTCDRNMYAPCEPPPSKSTLDPMCWDCSPQRERPVPNRNMDASTDRRPNHIRSIVKYKQALQQYDGWETNPQYLRTVQYLADHCPHEFVTDWVDIDPDRSQPITYCPRCETCR